MEDVGVRKRQPEAGWREGHRRPWEPRGRWASSENLIGKVSVWMGSPSYVAINRHVDSSSLDLRVSS